MCSVSLVHNRKIFRKSRGGTEASQQPVCCRVKCPAMNFATCRSDQLLRPAEHFLRSSSRKGQQQNPLRSDTTLDEVSDAIYESACLAGSCARDDEKRAVSVSCRGCLLWIQLRRKISLCLRVDDSLSSWINPSLGSFGHRTKYISGARKFPESFLLRCSRNQSVWGYVNCRKFEHLAKVLCCKRAHFLQARCHPRFLDDRCHLHSDNSTRNNEIEIREISGDVEGEAMPRDPVTSMNSNRPDLPAACPHTGVARRPLSGNPIFTDDPDDGLLDRPQVPVQILLVPLEIEHGVSNELAWPMERYIAATLHLEQLHTARAEKIGK